MRGTFFGVAAFLAGSLAVPAGAATITFNGQSGALVSGSPYFESGFSVAKEFGGALAFTNAGYDEGSGATAGLTVGSTGAHSGSFTISGTSPFSLTSFYISPTSFSPTVEIFGDGIDPVFFSSFGTPGTVSLASGTYSFFTFNVSGVNTPVTFDQFNVAAVPEPATWAMMLIGIGGVGFAMRRQRKNVKTTVAFA